VAELASVERAPLLATGAGRRKEIFRRMEAIFDQARNRAPRISGPALAAAGCGLAVLVSQSTPLNHLLGINRLDHRMVTSSDKRRLEIGSRGDIHFTKGNRDIDRLQPGGRFYLELREDGRTQRIEVEADGQGQIRRSYHADGIDQRFGPEAQRLLAREVTPWAMSRGEDINDTLNWLLEERGLDGALREIRAVPSAEAQRRFLVELLSRHGADESAARRVWRAAQGLDSDQEKRDFYRDASRLTPKLDAAAFVESIQSDEVKAELLEEFVQAGAAARALQLGRGLDSEERRQELLKLAWAAAEASAPGVAPIVEPASRLLESMQNEEARDGFLREVIAGKAPLAAVQDLFLKQIDSFASEERASRMMLAMFSRSDMSIALSEELTRRALRLHNAEARREIQEAAQKYGLSRRG
jgi:hypothetical protein